MVALALAFLLGYNTGTDAGLRFGLLLDGHYV